MSCTHPNMVTNWYTFGVHTPVYTRVTINAIGGGVNAWKCVWRFARYPRSEFFAPPKTNTFFEYEKNLLEPNDCHLLYLKLGEELPGQGP